MGLILSEYILVKYLSYFENRLNKYVSEVSAVTGNYDLIIKISESYLGMAFQDFLVNIRIHKNNFTHNNRYMFYLEFKDWMKNQNFEKINFKNNQFFLTKKLEYLRLINLLLNAKTLNLIFDIFKFPFGLEKMKLLIIFFIPKFLINLKFKYFNQ